MIYTNTITVLIAVIHAVIIVVGGQGVNYAKEFLSPAPYSTKKVNEKGAALILYNKKLETCRLNIISSFKISESQYTNDKKTVYRNMARKVKFELTINDMNNPDAIGYFEMIEEKINITAEFLSPEPYCIKKINDRVKKIIKSHKRLNFRPTLDIILCTLELKTEFVDSSRNPNEPQLTDDNQIKYVVAHFMFRERSLTIFNQPKYNEKIYTKEYFNEMSNVMQIKMFKTIAQYCRENHEVQRTKNKKNYNDKSSHGESSSRSPNRR